MLLYILPTSGNGHLRVDFKIPLPLIISSPLPFQGLVSVTISTARLLCPYLFPRSLPPPPIVAVSTTGGVFFRCTPPRIQFTNISIDGIHAVMMPALNLMSAHIQLRAPFPASLLALSLSSSRVGGEEGKGTCHILTGTCSPSHTRHTR